MQINPATTVEESKWSDSILSVVLRCRRWMFESFFSQDCLDCCWLCNHQFCLAAKIVTYHIWLMDQPWLEAKISIHRYRWSVGCYACSFQTCALDKDEAAEMLSHWEELSFLAKNITVLLPTSIPTMPFNRGIVSFGHFIWGILSPCQPVYVVLVPNFILVLEMTRWLLGCISILTVSEIGVLWWEGNVWVRNTDTLVMTAVQTPIFVRSTESWCFSFYLIY